MAVLRTVSFELGSLISLIYGDFQVFKSASFVCLQFSCHLRIASCIISSASCPSIPEVATSNFRELQSKQIKPLTIFNFIFPEFQAWQGLLSVPNRYLNTSLRYLVKRIAPTQIYNRDIQSQSWCSLHIYFKFVLSFPGQRTRAGTFLNRLREHGSSKEHDWQSFSSGQGE